MRRRGWYWLFVIPFVALLAPVYLRIEPTLGGFPFFYWYQLAWCVITAVLTAFVLRATREGRR